MGKIRKFVHRFKTKGLRYYCKQYKETGEVDDKCLIAFPFFKEIFNKFGEEWFKKRKYRKRDVVQAYIAMKHKEKVDIELEERFYERTELRKILKENNLHLKQLPYKVLHTKKAISKGIQVYGYIIKK